MAKDKDSIILEYERQELLNNEKQLFELKSSNDTQTNDLKALQARLNKISKIEAERNGNNQKCKIRRHSKLSHKALSYNDIYSIAEKSLVERGIDIDSFSYHNLISESELKAIEHEMNEPLPKEDKWCKPDYIVTFTAAFLGCAADLILSNRDNKLLGNNSNFSKALNRLHKHGNNAPIDYQGAGFGGGYHRELSKGHDLARFVEGIQMFKDGKFRGVRFIDGKKSDVIFSATQYDTPYAQLSTIEAILNYAQHMFGDLCSTYSLPFPGYSFFREGNSDFLRELAADMYHNGFNLKNIITQSLSAAIIEIIVRIYFGIQSVEKYKDQIKINEDYSNWETVHHFVSPDHKAKLNEMLLVAHAIVTAENLGKITIKCIAAKDISAISSVNITEIISTVRYGYSVVKATAKRNNEYSKLLYHCDNVSNHWELIEGSLANDEILAAQNVPDLLII